MQKLSFAIGVHGAPQANNDALFEALKAWSATLGVDGRLIVDVLGAGDATRVEVYTPGKVTVPGGWEALGEKCRELESQLAELIGDGEVRLERI